MQSPIFEHVRANTVNPLVSPTAVEVRKEVLRKFLRGLLRYAAEVTSANVVADAAIRIFVSAT